MADTRFLKHAVEPYVRKKLSEEFGSPFISRQVQLITGGSHEFDAVSEDGQIIAAIKTAGGKTATGKNPSGKINAALAELYFLSLVSAKRRLLILTTPPFYEILNNKLKGSLAPGLELKLILLPPKLQRRVSEIQTMASDEVSSEN